LFFGALVFPLLAGAHAMYDLPVAPLGALLAGHLYAASELARWSTQLRTPSVSFSVPSSEISHAMKRSTELSQDWHSDSSPSVVQTADILGSREMSGHVVTLFPIVVLTPTRRP
jgi:hypothetical protein